MKTPSLLLISCSLLLVLLIPTEAIAQKAYRTRASSNWADVATWQVSTNHGSTWVNASDFPGQGNGDSITIQTAHSLTLDAALTVNQVLILQGSLDLSSRTLTLTSGAAIIMPLNATSGRSTLKSTGGGSGVTASGTIIVSNDNYDDSTKWTARTTITGGTATMYGVFAGQFTANSGALIQVPDFKEFETEASSATVVNSGATIQGLGSGSVFSLDNGITMNGTTLSIVTEVEPGSRTLTTATGANWDQLEILTTGSGSSVTTFAGGIHHINGSLELNYGSGSWTSGSGGSIQFGSGATLIYTGSATQTATTLEFPASDGPTNLWLSNSGTVTLPATARTVTGELTIGDGTYTNLGNISGYTTLSYRTTSAKTAGAEFVTPLGTVNVYDPLGVTLNGAKTVSTAVNCVTGPLSTGAYVLTLGSSAYVTESGANYVQGVLSVTKNSVGTILTPCGQIGVTIAGGADDLGNVTVVRSAGAGSAVTVAASSGISRQWTISSTNPPASGRDVTFSWPAADDNGKDLMTAQVYWSSDGVIWAPIGAPQDVSGTHSITTTVSSFGYFTVSDAANPLPIQLASFTAMHVDASSTRLEWKTLSEVNNLGFYVQRRVGTTAPFADLPSGFVAGHGTTTVPQSYTFIDEFRAPESAYYRLKQIDLDGTIHFSDVIRAGVTTGVNDQIPASFGLEQNYPNPFNPSTTIRYGIPERSHVAITMYNLLGQLVATLVNGEQESGYHELKLDGSMLASGAYFYRLNAGSFVQTKRLLLLR